MTKTIKTRAVASLAVAALAVAGLAACGSDDSDSTSALSTDDFVSQTNAICKEKGGEIDKAASEFTKAPAGADLRGFVKDTVLPQYSAQIGQIQALDAPSDISDDVDTWLTDSLATRDAVGDDPTAVLTPDAFTKVNQEADDLGLGADCQAGPTA
jgi:type IV pilus biogenesis protein CpaD/CtpE